MASAFGTCPCCGGSMWDRPLTWMPEARVLVRGPHALIFTVMESKLFHALWKARDQGLAGLSTPQLFNEMYGLRSDGGPESGNNIPQFASIVRRKIKPFGLSIKPSHRWAGLYSLIGR